MSIVRFDQVSKRFTLRHERPRSLQELFLSALRLQRRSSKEPYWVLRDVSFTVEPGEMVGIIGENGVGKSTLLKLISRIIEPTSGEIQVDGRLSALLELGAGFHPELTGRENIYLNGSILGLSRAEMDGVFDDILDFSEMERFIDIPVKHYSSGMYMRLGFSIAIHVRPDILLVDEVLAVGDHSFQLRCLDRISEMKRRGITIILVTHVLDTVRRMCDRAIWLDGGKIQADGDVSYAVGQYVSEQQAADSGNLQGTETARAERDAQREDKASWRWGSGVGEIVRVELLDAQGRERRSFATGEEMVVRMHYLAHERIEEPQFGLALHNSGGFHINGPNTVQSGLEIEAIEGKGLIDYVIDKLPLLEGTYLLSVSLYDHEGVRAYDHHHQAYTFRVHSSDSIHERYGTVLIPAHWRMEPNSRETMP
jgi:lipopolysaccharide transport system ATP-binding protein